MYRTWVWKLWEDTNNPGGRNGIGKDMVINKEKEALMEAQTFVVGEGCFPTGPSKYAAFP